MQSCVVKAGATLLLATVVALSGCGGGSHPNVNPSVVAQVTLTLPTASLVAGEVTQAGFSAFDSTRGSVTPAPTFTFNSSNTKLVTISPAGLVCAGVWDSFFIVCNGSDASGNPIAGTANISATAGGVSSAPVQVTVHPSVTSIQVDPVASCSSIKQTKQFVAHAFHNATDITNLIGSFSWSVATGNVASIDTNGVVTATAPGVTGIIASVGNTSSPAVPFRTCFPIQILLHINGDAPGSPTTSATMNKGDTRTIEADMTDENGVTTNSAPVTLVSNNPTVATISGVTLTAASPGGAGIMAACIPPGCGSGLPAPMPVYSNLFSVTVSGTSPATTVYATTSFQPPSGTTPTMIPIDTSKNPPAAGTAISLPGAVNSLVFTTDGTKGFMGTTAGIASLDTTANTVTLLDPFVGKVLAVSPGGSLVIASNAANDPGTGTPIQPDGPSQRLVLLNATNNTAQSFVLPNIVAGAFTGDGFKAEIVASDGNVFFLTPVSSLANGVIAGSNFSAATVASGPYTYVANSAGLEVLGNCNNVQQPTANNPPTHSSTIQLVGAPNNADMIVAMDSSGVDIETVTINSVLSANPPPFTISPANCTPPVSYSNQFIDFGLGAITARQLLVPSNGTGGTNGSHIVVLPAGANQLLVAVPGGSGATIPLHSGATEALSGGLTPDGNTAWVGVAGTNTVNEINLTSNSDVLQIATSFKKSDSTPAPPNIVGVKPH